MKFIQCQNCDRKLLKIGKFDELSIKCPRCKTINHLSVTNAKPEVHETPEYNGETCGSNQANSQTA